MVKNTKLINLIAAAQLIIEPTAMPPVIKALGKLSKEEQDKIKKHDHICMKCNERNQFSMHGRCLKCGFHQYSKLPIAE